MIWQKLFYTSPYLISLLISVGVGLYARRRPGVAGAVPLSWGALAQALVAGGTVLELSNSSLQAKIFWDNWRFIGVVAAPMALLALALEYTDRKLPQPTRVWSWLALVSIVFVLLAWSDSVLGLVRDDFRLVSDAPLGVLAYDFTSLGYIMFAYLAVLVLASVFLLCTEFIRSQPIYRPQVGVIIIGSLVPQLGGALTMLDATPTFQQDILPFTFSIGSLVTAWGLFRYRLFDVVLLARDTIIECMMDAVLALDVHDRVVDLNPVALALIGDTRSEVIGRPASRVLSKWPDLVARYQDALGTHTEIVMDVKGRQRHFDLMLSPLHDHRQRLAGRLIVLHDISLRVRAELQRDSIVQELKRRHRELATLYEAATAINSNLSLEIVIQTVAEHMVQTLNLSGCSLSRWDRERDLVETLVDYNIVEPDATDPVGSVYYLDDYPATRLVLESGQPMLIRLDDPLADSAELAFMAAQNISTLLMLPLLAREQAMGLVELIDSVQARDFTLDQVRLAQSLAAHAAVAIENAQLYEQVQQGLLEQAMLFDASQRLASAPLQVQEIAAIAARQLARVLDDARCHFSLLVPGEDALQVVASYWVKDGVDSLREIDAKLYRLADYPATARVMETLEPLVVQASDPHADPAELAYMREFDCATLVIIPLTVKGQSVGVLELETPQERVYTPKELNVATTLANQAMGAIENARLYEAVQRELEERVRAEEALRQRSAELEARNEELDAFAHTVAHDLKGPLGPIVGYAQILEEYHATLPQERVRDYMRLIVESGVTMGSIIDELLLLATMYKMEEIELESLDMASLVSSACKRLAFRTRDSQAEFLLPPEDAWPAALGYGPWVEEVWVNYISNAIKYGGEPPRVELGFGPGGSREWGVGSGQSVPTTDRQPPATTIRFWVRDNGPGIKPEEQARLFTLFTRLDKARAKGHGLGLSIARRIVERLGGQVGVESELGVGSVFWFSLPAVGAGRTTDDEAPVPGAERKGRRETNDEPVL